MSRQFQDIFGLWIDGICKLMTRNRPRGWRPELAASEDKDPKTLRPWTLPCRWLWSSPHSSVPGDRICCFSRKLADLLTPRAGRASPHRMKTEVHRDGGPMSPANGGSAGSSIAGPRALAAPGAKAMSYSRKEARAWWAETQPNTIMIRHARLCLIWKRICISWFKSNTWDRPPK